MEIKSFFAQDVQGNIIPSPTVYFYQPGTTTTVSGLQDASGNALTNPFTGSATGQIQVAAPGGDYDMRIVSGLRDYTMRVRFIDTTSVASAEAQVAQAAAHADEAGTQAAQAAGSAAQALAIYGNTAAVQTAVAQAAAQASLAQGYAASASSVVQQDLSGVTAAALHRSPNAITALFVYDTSKDSDGGAWTEKCQHTSWYNEDINGKWLGAVAGANIGAAETTARAISGAATSDYFQATFDGKFYRLNATSGVTEVFRGNKRDFPRLAGIVAEAGNVNIYDLTEPGRPMWGRYVPSTNGGPSINGIAAAQGQIWWAGSSGSISTRMLDFARDRARHVNTSLSSGRLWERAMAFGSHVVNGTGLPCDITVVNASCNAVAMTVLPDAPVDPVTGLRVPTIAVATSGGISVIQHSGVVRNSSSTGNFNSITITPQLLTAGRADTVWYYAYNPGALGASFALSTRTNAQAPDFNVGNTNGLIGMTRSELLRRSATAATVQKLKNFEADPAKSLAATITNTFNTSWQNGDIRRAYLSDVDVGSLTLGPELVTFASLSASEFVFGSGVWTLTNSATNGANLQFSNLTIGKTYVFSVTVDSISSGSLTFRHPNNSTVLTGSPTITAAGTYTAYFIATSTSAWVINSAAGQSIVVSAFSIKEGAVLDRSYKAGGASITGTLTKSAVASAAELVAYSGFSASNYLREPYSADLDFGTGEWSVGAWVNTAGRRNLLTYSEQFDNAAWQKSNATVTADAVVAPDGASTADTVTNTVNNAGYFYQHKSATTFVFSVYLKAGTQAVVGIGEQTKYNQIGAFNLSTGTATKVNVNSPNDCSVAIESVGNGWYRCIVTGTVSAIAAVNICGGATYLGRAWALGTTFHIWGAQLEASPAASAYQKVVDGTELYFPVADRSHSSGASLSLGLEGTGKLKAVAFDGTTTRTVTTSAAYNTATWVKPEAVYTTDGTLAIRVNGVEVAATRGNPLLTLNNSNAVLTIGNSYATDAPFPGSISLLKLSATVPTPEQSVWMYEQEKQLFRAGAKCCLPDSGSILDLTYDDATDKWIAISATNESEWSGLVRTSVTAVPAGSYTKAIAASGVQMLARTTTSPGVDITIPAYGLREELVKRAEAAARMNAQLATYDYVGGFTANTTTGNTAITSVANLTYPTSYIGARVSGSGIPANTTIVAVSGTTIYLSAAATATATGVQISFVDYVLPVGMEAKEVSLAGVAQREGSTAQFTRLFDGFKETIRFGTAPAHNSLIQIQAVRGAA